MGEVIQVPFASSYLRRIGLSVGIGVPVNVYVETEWADSKARVLRDTYHGLGDVSCTAVIYTINGAYAGIPVLWGRNG